MSDKIGNLSFQNTGDPQFQKPYSEQTAQMIDDEVRTLVRTAVERTRSLLKERQPELKKIAERLLAKVPCVCIGV